MAKKIAAADDTQQVKMVREGENAGAAVNESVSGVANDGDDGAQGGVGGSDSGADGGVSGGNGSEPDAAGALATGELEGAGPVGSSAPPEEPQADETAEAIALVTEKLKPLNDKAAKLGLVAVNADGTREPIKALFEVKAAVPMTKDGEDPLVCKECGFAAADAPGLKRHVTFKHGGRVASAAPRAAKPAADEGAIAEPTRAEPQPEREERKAEIMAPTADGIEFDALSLLDEFILPHLPPPLDEREKRMLQRCSIRVTVPQKLVNIGVIVYVLGPRLVSKFFELKQAFEEEAERKEVEVKARRERESAVAAAAHRAARPAPEAAAAAPEGPALVKGSWE